MSFVVYMAGRRLKLQASQSIGKGGEADVFDDGNGRAIKIFKSPSHADYAGFPAEQKAAEARLALHQTKLRQFPAPLPQGVVAPRELVTDRGGQVIVGYAMDRVAAAEPLLRYGEPCFRRAGISQSLVVGLFRRMLDIVVGLHSAGMVIGDFNDLNVLVTPNHEPRFIDVDSYQFGAYPCTVYTERFVDPILCDPTASAPRLVRPYTSDADWYAFAALLLQSLLLVGPFGGVHKPKDAARRVAHAARPLHRITVFHPDVVYPKPAVPFGVLPDELLDRFLRIFERGERGPFPRSLLDALHFARCPQCAIEHARLDCPQCHPSQAAASRPRRAATVHGRVVSRRVFETPGVIVHACVEQGELRFLYHDDGAYRREDGRLVVQGTLDPALRFRILDSATLVGRGSELIVLDESSPPARLTVDSDGSGPAFDTNGRHRYWSCAGRLWRQRRRAQGDRKAPGAAQATAPNGWLDAAEAIGDVLAGQTRIWAGPNFGLGFYRAANLSVAFVFDADGRGILDTLPLPRLRGELTEAEGVLDAERAWLLLALHGGGRKHHFCLAYSRTGALEGIAQTQAGDESWLGAALGGKCAVKGVLLAPTDAGIVRVELRQGNIEETARFADTEPFVTADCRLLATARGLCVVRDHVIEEVSMN